MAVLISSNLRKEIAGTALFDGVSFKVERRDRLALAGANGAGKTTLLRALAGEIRLEGGELAWEKGARVALHDQRPPATSNRPLREYVLAGTSDLVAVETELRRLEAAMAGGDHDPKTLARYGSAQARLEHAGGYDWRERAAGVIRGLGFTDDDLDRPLTTFSGGELTRASLARALAAQPDLLLLDEPTNHLDIDSIEWLEELLRTIDAAVILVAHDRWFLEAVTTAVLQLPRAGGAGDSRGEDRRSAGGGDRPPRAVRRAVPREEHEGQAGAVEAETDRPNQGSAGRGRRPRTADTRLRIPEAEALRAHRRRDRRTRGARRRQGAAARRVVRARARRARLARGAKRGGQDDTARDAARLA
jgi:ATPase subunit of ABC transporter with duplicated ATPase domains